MSTILPIFKDGIGIGLRKDNKIYIYLSSIAMNGKYESGKFYIKNRCKKLGIKMHFSDCIELDELKNIFIPVTNGIHKRNLLLFVSDI